MMALCAELRAQQDPLFSQYMFHELIINPAYAGYKQDLYAHASYRAQWMGIEGAPQTFALGVDMAASRSMSWGLQLSNDRIGLLSTTSAMAAYAYRIKLAGSAQLALGLSLGGIYANMRADQLVSTADNTAYAAIGQLTPDAALGLYLHTDWWYVGLSAQRLMASALGFSDNENGELPRYNPHLFLSTGVLLYLNRSFKLKPSLLYREDLHSPSSIDLNLMLLFLHERLWLGVSYRTSLTLWKAQSGSGAPNFEGRTAVFLAEFYATNRIRIGYSYDHSFAPAATAFSSAHELSLGFYLGRDKQRVYSPRFF
jgi:type IX secretion system PorP/SprF family membrane protein